MSGIEGIERTFDIAKKEEDKEGIKVISEWIQYLFTEQVLV